MMDLSQITILLLICIHYTKEKNESEKCIRVKNNKSLLLQYNKRTSMLKEAFHH